MKRRNTIGIALAALLAAALAAGAIAATGALSPQQESQAVVDDAAERLGVESSALSSALKAALKARVDAAVEAGQLTEAQGTELKSRIDSDEYPLVGLGRGGHGHGPGLGHGAGLAAAASYLGLTEAELRAAFDEGKTLAEVAADEGKSVDGLVAAMVKAATDELEQGVADGRLTEAQKQSIVATLEARVRAKVNREPGSRGGRFGPPAGGPGGPSSGSAFGVLA